MRWTNSQFFLMSFLCSSSSQSSSLIYPNYDTLHYLMTSYGVMVAIGHVSIRDNVDDLHCYHRQQQRVAPHSQLFPDVRRTAIRQSRSVGNIFFSSFSFTVQDDIIAFDVVCDVRCHYYLTINYFIWSQLIYCASTSFLLLEVDHCSQKCWSVTLTSWLDRWRTPLCDRL